MVVVRKRERKGVDLETSECDDVTSAFLFFSEFTAPVTLPPSSLKAPSSWFSLPRAGRTTRPHEP